LEEEVIAACLIDWNWVPPRDYIPVGTWLQYTLLRDQDCPTVFRYAGMDVSL